jgi:hypothetical protein
MLGRPLSPREAVIVASPVESEFTCCECGKQVRGCSYGYDGCGHFECVCGAKFAVEVYISDNGSAPEREGTFEEQHEQAQFAGDEG